MHELHMKCDILRDENVKLCQMLHALNRISELTIRYYTKKKLHYIA